MSKIGIIGLGKLGLPVALAIEDKGHQVVGWDNSEVVRSNISARVLPYQEIGAEELLKKTKIELTQDFNGCDIVFMAIQTPHDPLYEGITRIPEERADFDYSFLIQAVKDFVANQTQPVILVLISTVLPGTIDREIKHLLNDKIYFIYNPFFIAMGTVIPDFLNPEFVLLGTEDSAMTWGHERHEKTVKKIREFYSTIHNKELAIMPIIDAELTKVSYNTFIGMKIVFVNTLMEICHKNGGNVDNVTNALKMATDRLISPKYMSAGMGDGGGCHPRDNIAMSFLAKRLNLSHNIFEDIMKAREDQTEWLISVIKKYHGDYDRLQMKEIPTYILGKSFKPETNLTIGSPSVLLANMLREDDIQFGHIGEDEEIPSVAATFFIGVKHQKYADHKFPMGSIVIDPFGYIPEQESVTVISLGRAK